MRCFSPGPAMQDFRHPRGGASRRTHWRAVTKLSNRKLQLPLNCLKARLLAYGVQERVGLEHLQTRVAQTPRRLERFERLRPIAPLRIDRGVLVRRGIALCRLQFRKLGFRIRVPAELVIDYREALLTPPVIPLRLAGGARALKIPEPVKAKPANRVARLEFGIKTDDFCPSRDCLLIAAGHIQRLGERAMAVASKRVEHDRAAGGRNACIEVPH